MFHNNVVEALPSADNLPWRPLEARYIHLERTKALLMLVLLVVASIVLWLLLAEPLLLWLLPLAFVVGTANLLYHHAAVKRFGYVVREHDIQSIKGLYWRTQTALSYCRIQHVTINQGPWQRKLALAQLNLYSAGSASAELVIPGLDEQQAQTLRQWLLEQADVKAADHD